MPAPPRGPTLPGVTPNLAPSLHLAARALPSLGGFFLQAEGTLRVVERTGRRGRSALRAVKNSDPAKNAPAKRAPRQVAPKSVAEAAASGDRRQLLVALGNRVGKALDDPKTAGPALAALIKQARDIAETIAAIDQAAEAASAPSGPESVIATTPDEAWDESMI